MKKMVYCLFVVLCFSYLMGEDIERVKELSKEVVILNLLNGIEFSTEQKLSIKSYIKKVEEIEESFEREAEEQAELFEIGLEKSIEVLSNDNELPPSLRKDISTYSNALKEMKREKDEKIFRVAEEVKEILEPQQVYQLRDFVPCLIPPPGKARVGQTSSPEMIAKHLEKIRKLPDEIYIKQREHIIDRAIKKEKEYMRPFDEFDEEAERERLGNILDRVRDMSDVDFALNKEKIAEEFKGKTKKDKPENDVLLKIRRFLLDPIVLKYI